MHTLKLKERVVEFLSSQPGRDMCVGCISRALDVSHKSAHEATLKLEAVPAFRRAYGQCAACGKTRIVVKARDGADGA